MSCDEEQATVDDLLAAIQDLQDGLENALPGDKPHFIAKIDKAQAKLSVAKKDLEHCLAGTRLRAALTATIVLQTSNDHAPGPFFVDGVVIPMLFEGDPLALIGVSLPTIQPDPFPVPVFGSNTTTISQDGAANSSFDRATGRIVISVSLHFHHSVALAGDSDLSIALTTDETRSPGEKFHSTGSRVDPAGNVKLVAGGKFAGGFLGDSDCLITVQGRIDPSPRG